MDDLGSIGGLEKAGQGGGSYGNYYLPARQKSVQSEPSKLKQGEVIIGTILEIISKDLAKVKLPMGSFTASLHGRLKSGDTLFFYVSEISPSLILRVYSVSASQNGKVRSAEEIIRILDLPEKNVYFDLIDYLRANKSVILRNESLMFANILEKLEYTSKKYKKSALFKAIFLVLLALGKEEHELARNFYPAFFPMNELFKLADSFAKAKVDIFSDESKYSRKISDNTCFLDLYSDNSELFKFLTNSDKSQNDGELLSRFINSINSYNQFAEQYHQAQIVLFGLKHNDEFLLGKLELFSEKAETYNPNQIASLSVFVHSITSNCNLEDLFLVSESDKDETLGYDKVPIVGRIKREASNLGFVVTLFSIYSSRTGEIILSEGLLKAAPRNFSIVV